MTLDELAKKLDAFENVDGTEFRRRARVLQSMWRAERGYPMGKHKGRQGSRPLGSRLQMPWARETLSNYLTDAIRNVVRAEVMEAEQSRGKLYSKPRIFNDLLSSQPLAFNLFGELKQDLKLCSRLIESMTSGRFRQVDKVEFEYSPSRRDPKLTDDRSAFDVFLQCRGASVKHSFVGIEVKYHENLKNNPAGLRARYDEIADKMGCFATKSRSSLKESPLQQIWRDHLLACSMLQTEGYEDGLFVFLYPKDNYDCSSAIEAYRRCLTDERTLAACTLEDVVEILRRHSHAGWINSFHDRYLAFDKVTRRMIEP